MSSLRQRLDRIFLSSTGVRDYRTLIRRTYRRSIIVLVIVTLLVLVLLRACISRDYNPDKIDLSVLINGTVGHIPDYPSSAVQLVAAEPRLLFDGEALLKLPCADRVGDPDCDGIPNPIEKSIGTDHRAADSDRDGVEDLEEMLEGYDPANPQDVPGATRRRWGLQMAQMLQRIDLAEQSLALYATRTTEVEARADIITRDFGKDLPSERPALLSLIYGRDPSPAEIEVAEHFPLPNDSRSFLLRILSGPPAAKLQMTRIFRRVHGDGVSDDDLQVLLRDVTYQENYNVIGEIGDIFGSERLYAEKCGSDPMLFVRFLFLKLLGRLPRPEEAHYIHTVRTADPTKRLPWRLRLAQSLLELPIGKRALLADFAIGLNDRRSS